MTIIYERCCNGFRQTIRDENIKSSTNNMQKIYDVLSKLPSDPKIIQKIGDDYIMVYEHNDKIILKNYYKYRNEKFFQQVLATIKNYPPSVRIKKINHKGIAAILGGGIVLVSVTLSMFHQPSSLQKNSNSQKISFNNGVGRSDVIEIEEIEQDNSLIEQNFIDEQNYDLIFRLEQSSQLYKGEISNNINIPIGTNLNEYTTNKLVDFINSNSGQYCFDICEQFGIDPYLFVSLMMKESSLNHQDTLPGSQYYNGCAVGICQLETPQGQEITAFNYSTNQEETIYETMDNAIDENCNIKMGIMRFQNVLAKYKGNQYLALQSYNYGQGLVDLIVCVYADEIGSTYDEVVANYNDVNWLKYVEQVHNDPIGFANSIDLNKYPNFKITVDYLKNWSYQTYGDDKYISSTLSYYIGVYGKSIVDGNIVERNNLNNEVNITNLEQVENNFKIS